MAGVLLRCHIYALPAAGVGQTIQVSRSQLRDVFDLCRGRGAVSEHDILHSNLFEVGTLFSLSSPFLIFSALFLFVGHCGAPDPLIFTVHRQVTRSLSSRTGSFELPLRRPEIWKDRGRSPSLQDFDIQNGTKEIAVDVQVGPTLCRGEWGAIMAAPGDNAEGTRCPRNHSTNWNKWLSISSLDLDAT